MTDNDDAKTATPATPFPSFASLRAAHSELLEREPENKEDVEYFDAVEEFFNRARETGALLSDEEERRASQSIVNYWLTVLYRVERQPKQTTLVQLRPDLRPNLKDAECPYPGPRAFIEKERKFFFGRYGQIEYMLARFKVESFLVLLGPSGTGKSSLVQAGLIPALRRLDSEDEPNCSRMHFFPVITPGKNPLRNLATVLEQMKLGPEADAQKHYEKMRATLGYLADMLREHLKAPVVIVIDQFEEIFTLCRDQQLREAFVESLMRLNDGRNKIILCMTDDDYNRELNKLPALKEHFKRASTVLPKLGLSELTDAIVKPAEIVGLKFKEQTVKDIVQEIANEPVGLPLLQFTLLKLWEKRVGDETPDQFSKRMGSCRQILSQSAESLFKGFNDKQQDAAQKVLSRFIKVDGSGAHTRLVLRDDLEEIEGGGKVVDAMEREHIVRLTKSARPSDVQVEIVHDSLLSDWTVMKKLVKEKERRRSMYRMMRYLIGLLLIVGIGYVAYGLIEDRVEAIQHQRQRDAAIKWAAESGKELAGSRVDLAFMLALAAYRTDANVNTRGALLDVLRYSPRPKAFIKQTPVMTGDVALSSDGLLLAANDADGSIAIWDLRGGWQEPRVRMRDENASAMKEEITPLAFSPDGQLLASGSTSAGSDKKRLAAVALWNIADSTKVILNAEEDAAEINCIAFAPDGRKLAAGDERGNIYLWNIADGGVPLVLREHKDAVNALRFSPDGNLLASGSNDGNAITWDLKSGRRLRVLNNEDCKCLKEAGGGQKEITDLAFNKQGNKLFVGSTEDVVLYDFTSRSYVMLSSDQNSVSMFLSLSDDDKTLQGVDSRGNFYLWDVGKGSNIKIIRKKLFRPLAAAWSMAFSHDGNTMALSGENGLSAWDIAWKRPLSGHDRDVNGLAFSTDGRVLASAGDDGKVILWDAASHKLLRELSNKGRAAYGVAFSHTGDLLAAGSVTGSIALWKVSDEQDNGTFLEMPNDLGGQPDEPSAIAFTPDDKTVVTLSTYIGDETKVYLSAWDVEQGQRLRPPIPLPLTKGDEVTSAAFSSDGRVLALATEKEKEGGSVITLWDAISGEQINGSLRDQARGSVESLALSANGMWVAAGKNKERRVILWNPQTRETQFVPFVGQSGSISHLAFSADGKTLSMSIEPETGNFSAESVQGENHSVVLWDIGPRPLDKLGNPIAQYQSSDDWVLSQLGSSFSGQESSTTALAFSPNGKLFAIADDSKSLMIWDIDVRGAEAIICGIANRKFTDEEVERYQEAIYLTKPCRQTFWGEASSH